MEQIIQKLNELTEKYRDDLAMGKKQNLNLYFIGYKPQGTNQVQIKYLADGDLPQRIIDDVMKELQAIGMVE